MNAILVTGATGNVGRPLVTQLAAAGVEVRAVTRQPDTARFPDGVKAVRTAAEGLPGASAVFLNSRCVGAYCNGLKWYVNGKQQTGDPQNDVLQSHDEIAIVVGKPPKQIPSSYHFLQGE